MASTFSLAGENGPPTPWKPSRPSPRPRLGGDPTMEGMLREMERVSPGNYSAWEAFASIGGSTRVAVLQAAERNLREQLKAASPEVRAALQQSELGQLYQRQLQAVQSENPGYSGQNVLTSVDGKVGGILTIRQGTPRAPRPGVTPSTGGSLREPGKLGGTPAPPAIANTRTASVAAPDATPRLQVTTPQLEDIFKELGFSRVFGPEGMQTFREYLARPAFNDLNNYPVLQVPGFPTDAPDEIVERTRTLMGSFQRSGYAQDWARMKRMIYLRAEHPYLAQNWGATLDTYLAHPLPCDLDQQAQIARLPDPSLEGLRRERDRRVSEIERIQNQLKNSPLTHEARWQMMSDLALQVNKLGGIDVRILEILLGQSTS